MKEKNPYLQDLLFAEYYQNSLQKLREKFSPNSTSTIQNNYFFTTNDGTKLYTREWTSKNAESDKIIVCYHGFSGHSEYYVLFADQLVKFGFKVIAFDYIGHGLSEGKRGDIKNFDILLDQGKEILLDIIKKNSGIPIFVMGESMGGAVIINILINSISDNLPINGVILFAPAVKIKAEEATFNDVISMIWNILLFPFRPGRLAMYTRPRKNNIREDGTPLMDPIHFKYDSQNKLHLDYISLRFGLKLTKIFKRAFKLGPEALKYPSIIFSGELDSVIDRKSVLDFFERIIAKEKEFVNVENSPHAVFTSPFFQKYWKYLGDWCINHIKI